MEDIRHVYPLNVAGMIFGYEGSGYDLECEKAQALCNDEKFLEDYNHLLSTLGKNCYRKTFQRIKKCGRNGKRDEFRQRIRKFAFISKGTA